MFELTGQLGGRVAASEVCTSAARGTWTTTCGGSAEAARCRRTDHAHERVEAALVPGRLSVGRNLLRRRFDPGPGRGIGLGRQLGGQSAMLSLNRTYRRSCCSVDVARWTRVRPTSASSRTECSLAWSTVRGPSRVWPRRRRPGPCRRTTSPPQREPTRWGTSQAFSPTWVRDRAVAAATPKRSPTHGFGRRGPFLPYVLGLRSTSPSSTTISPSMAARLRKSSLRRWDRASWRIRAARPIMSAPAEHRHRSLACCGG